MDRREVMRREVLGKFVCVERWERREEDMEK